MGEEKISDLVRAIHDDPLIRAAVEEAERSGSPLYLVGGWIRDQLLGRQSKDYDFIFDGDVVSFAEEMGRRLGAPSFVMGHEVPPNYRIVGHDFTMDIVPLHPKGLDSELRRRDLTINTIAFSFSENKLYDPLEGRRDIEKKAVRIVAPHVLDADPLRMLRAVRFKTTLPGFHLTSETMAEIQKDPERLSESAVERVRDEMDGIMVSGNAAQGLCLMKELGLLRIVLPDLLELCGLDQGPHHHLDGFDHTLQTVQEVDDLHQLTNLFDYVFDLDQENIKVLSYAALLHDVGKAHSLTLDKHVVTHFYGHEKIGADMAGRIMNSLCFPRNRAMRIRHLIRYHVIGLGLIQTVYTQKVLRRILRRLGDDLPLHVLLSMADRRSAMGRDYKEKEKRAAALGQALLDLYQGEGDKILSPPSLINGEDVKKALGLSQGPAVGAVLDRVRNLQIDEEIQNREEALGFLQKLRSKQKFTSSE